MTMQSPLSSPTTPTPIPKPRAVPLRSTRRASSAKNRPPSVLNWKQSNGRNAHVSSDSVAAFPKTSLAASPSEMPRDQASLTAGSRRLTRHRWSMSILSIVIAALGIAFLSTILRSLVARESDSKGCRMSYMRPSYMRFSEFDTEHTRFATKYSLYLYREQGIDDENKVCIAFPRLHGSSEQNADLRSPSSSGAFLCSSSRVMRVATSRFDP